MQNKSLSPSLHSSLSPYLSISLSPSPSLSPCSLCAQAEFDCACRRDKFVEDFKNALAKQHPIRSRIEDWARERVDDETEKFNSVHKVSAVVLCSV